MRVELYGCDYGTYQKEIKGGLGIKVNISDFDLFIFNCFTVSQTLYFNGTSLVYRNLTYHPIQSRKDVIKFRFKTAQPDGILMYSKGTQSDFFALQLVDNRLILNINLGKFRRSNLLELYKKNFVMR